MHTWCVYWWWQCIRWMVLIQGVKCVTLSLFVGRVVVLSEKQRIIGYKRYGVGYWCYNDVTVYV